MILLAPALAVRAGLRALLTTNKNIDVIGEAANLSEYASSIANVDVIVALVEAVSPQALEKFLAELEAPPALLLLSEQDNPLGALLKFPLRAWGLLPLEATEEEYSAAVTALHLGLVSADPILLDQLLAQNSSRSLEDEERVIEDLTNREMEVLELLSEGLANKQIALELEISEHTVKFHVSSIYTKLGATNRIEAVTLGARLGLIVL